MCGKLWSRVLTFRSHDLLAAGRTGTGSPLQFQETLAKQQFEPGQIRCGVYVAAKSEIGNAVIAEDGTVDRHLPADRHIRVPIQHLVAKQVEGELRSLHVRTHQIER